MPTKKLVSPSELGISLFDFVMLSSKKLLSEEFGLNKIKGVNISRDDLYDIEIVIVYMWLVFHLLNLKGENTKTRRQQCMRGFLIRSRSQNQTVHKQWIY